VNWTKNAPLAFATLCALTGCSLFPRPEAIPSSKVPHRVAEETCVEIYVRLPDGSFRVETVRLLKGWWIASPEVVE